MSKIKAIASRVLFTLFMIAIFLFAIFLLQNMNLIDVNFLIFTLQIPIIVLMLVTTIVGFLGGYLSAIRMRQIRKTPTDSNINNLDHENLKQEGAN